MHRSFFLAVMGLCALTCAPVMAQKRGFGREADAGKHGWLFSLAEGKALAQKTNKPLMVVLRCVP